MLYAGIDLHRKYLVVVVLDRGGAVVDERRLPNDAEVVRAYFDGRGEPVRVVVEAMGSWHWLYDVLIEAGIAATLAHPWKLRAIAAAKLKNDQVDARMLAHLLRTGLTPQPMWRRRRCARYASCCDIGRHWYGSGHS